MADPTRRTRSLARPEAAFALVPETRGLRIRPRPRSKLSWVGRALETAARAGFNAVVIDAVFGGLTSYPSCVAVQAGLPEQYPGLSSDFVAEASEHADRLGLMLYAGVDVALLGRNASGALSPLRRRHPEWLAQARNGRHLLKDGPEPESWFFCPANPEVRRYVANIVYELCEAYRLDGLFLDYLRFPLRAAFPQTAFCFCESCCEGVARDLGFDLEKMPMSLEDPDYLRWTAWRGEQLTRFLYSIRTRTQKARDALRVVLNTPGGYAPDILQRDVMHDWIAWVREGLVSLVALRYSSGVHPKPEAALKSDLAQAPSRALLYSSISARDFEQEFLQLRVAREAGLAGFFYLVKPGLSREQARMIGDLLRPEAIPVERDPLLSAAYYLSRAIEDVGNVPELAEKLKALRSQLLGEPRPEPGAMGPFVQQIEQVRQSLVQTPEVSASQSLPSYLASAAKLLEVYEAL